MQHERRAEPEPQPPQRHARPLPQPARVTLHHLRARIRRRDAQQVQARPAPQEQARERRGRLVEGGYGVSYESGIGRRCAAHRDPVRAAIRLVGGVGEQQREVATGELRVAVQVEAVEERPPP